MKMEEIIEFDGIIDLSNKESLEIKDIENLNKEFQNEFLCRIFDSSYYMNVNYIFDYSKVLKLFNEYENKYGQPAEWDKNILTYHYWENGGVSDIDSIKKCKVNIDENGCFIGAICMEAHGKKQFGWG